MHGQTYIKFTEIIQRLQNLNEWLVNTGGMIPTRKWKYSQKVLSHCHCTRVHNSWIPVRRGN